MPVTGNDERFRVSVAAPVISEGDVMGAVLFVNGNDGSSTGGEVENKLAQTIANFLGKQMEA